MAMISGEIAIHKHIVDARQILTGVLRRLDANNHPKTNNLPSNVLMHEECKKLFVILAEKV
jgi:hypothetical protein